MEDAFANEYPEVTQAIEVFKCKKDAKSILRNMLEEWADQYVDINYTSVIKVEEVSIKEDSEFYKENS